MYKNSVVAKESEYYKNRENAAELPKFQNDKNREYKASRGRNYKYFVLPVEQSSRLHELYINGQKCTIYGVVNGCRNASLTLNDELNHSKPRNVLVFDWHPLQAFEYAFQQRFSELDFNLFNVRSKNDMLNKSLVKDSFAWYFKEVLHYDRSHHQVGADGNLFVRRDKERRILYYDAYLAAAWYSMLKERRNLYAGRVNFNQEMIYYLNESDEFTAELGGHLTQVALQIFEQLNQEDYQVTHEYCKEMLLKQFNAIHPEYFLNRRINYLFQVTNFILQSYKDVIVIVDMAYYKNVVEYFENNTENIKPVYNDKYDRYDFESTNGVQTIDRVYPTLQDGIGLLNAKFTQTNDLIGKEVEILINKFTSLSFLLDDKCYKAYLATKEFAVLGAKVNSLLSDHYRTQTRSILHSASILDSKVAEAIIASIGNCRQLPQRNIKNYLKIDQIPKKYFCFGTIQQYYRMKKVINRIDHKILSNIKEKIRQGYNQLSETMAFNQVKSGVITDAELEMYMRLYIEANDELKLIPYSKQHLLLKEKIKQEAVARERTQRTIGFVRQADFEYSSVGIKLFKSHSRTPALDAVYPGLLASDSKGALTVGKFKDPAHAANQERLLGNIELMWNGTNLGLPQNSEQYAHLSSILDKLKQSTNNSMSQEEFDSYKQPMIRELIENVNKFKGLTPPTATSLLKEYTDRIKLAQYKDGININEKDSDYESDIEL